MSSRRRPRSGDVVSVGRGRALAAACLPAALVLALMGGCGTAPVGRPAGPALSNTAGQPLYVYHDQPGSPASRACAAECSPAWTPLYAGDLDVPGRGFTILKRDDGSLQWAYRGEPVYYYSGYARELDRDLQWRAGLWVPVVAPQ